MKKVKIGLGFEGLDLTMWEVKSIYSKVGSDEYTLIVKRRKDNYQEPNRKDNKGWGV
jgi:hypothetical protein